MYFPSLSVLTTLACAAFSIAAPVDLNAIKDKVENTVANVPRDVPAAPSPPTNLVAPLEIDLEHLATDLAPAIEALQAAVNSVKVKASVDVDSDKIKAALEDVATVVTVYVGKIKESATQSVENIRAQVVAKLLYNVISTIVSALVAVSEVANVVEGVYGTVATIITTKVAEIVVTVAAAVPAVVDLVVDQVKPLAQTILQLNAGAILKALGMETPFS